MPFWSFLPERQLRRLPLSRYAYTRAAARSYLGSNNLAPRSRRDKLTRLDKDVTGRNPPRSRRESMFGAPGRPCLNEIGLFSTLSRVDIPVSQVPRLTAARGYLNPPRSILNRDAAAILATSPARSASVVLYGASETYFLGKPTRDTPARFSPPDACPILMPLCRSIDVNIIAQKTRDV